MNTKHTPGPWHVTGWPGDGGLPDGCSIGIDDDFGADGGRDYFLATVVHGDPEELAANARLVAAAPELLAALQELANEYGPHTGRMAVDSPRLAMWFKARAAIAKATGDQA